MLKVVGYKFYSFKDQKTGNDVSGCNVYLANEINPDHGKGVEFEKLSISSNYIQEVVKGNIQDLLNKEVFVQYNKYGKPAYIGAK